MKIFLSRVSYTSVLTLALVFTFVFFLRDITKVADMDLYLNEIIFLKDNSILNSRLFWKGEYFYLLILKSVTFLPAKFGLYSIVFFSLFIFLKSSFEIAKYFELNILFLLLCLFTSLSFYMVFGNIIRQGIAISLIMLSYSYHLKKSIIKPIIFLIMAFFTHISCVVLIIPFLLTRIKFSTRIFVLLVSLAVSLFFIIEPYFILKINSYSMVNSDITKDLIKLSTGVVVLIFAFFNRKVIDIIFLKSYSFIILISIIFISVESIGSRLLIYSQILTPFIFAFILGNKKSLKNQTTILTSCISVVYFLLIFSTPTFKSLFPY